MPKRALPRRVLINSWLANYDRRYFRTDGTNIFCKLCQKYVSSEKRFHLIQHVRTAMHQNNTKDEKLVEDRLKDTALDIPAPHNSAKTSSSGQPELECQDPSCTTLADEPKMRTKYASKSTCFICCCKLLVATEETTPVVNCAKLNSKSIMQLLKPIFIDDILNDKENHTRKKDSNKLVIREFLILKSLQLQLRHVDYCRNCSEKLKNYLSIYQQLKEIQNEMNSLRQDVVGNIRKHYHSIRQEQQISNKLKKFSKKRLKEQGLREEIVKGIAASSQSPIISTTTTSATSAHNNRECDSAFVKITPLKVEPSAYFEEDESFEPFLNENIADTENNTDNDFNGNALEDHFQHEMIIDIKPDVSALNTAIMKNTTTFDGSTNTQESDNYQFVVGSQQTLEIGSPIKLNHSYKPTSSQTGTERRSKITMRKPGKRLPKFVGPFKCNECGKFFKHHRNLKQHMNLHLKPYKCTICNLDFSWRYTLNIHESTTHPELNNKPLPKCTKCGKVFGKESTLLIHMKSVHECLGEFMCHMCPYIGSQLPNLKRHVKLVHDKIKEFKCEVCDSMFGRKEDLKIHTFLHTGEKPFSCSICGKNFRVRQKCKVHELTHGGGQLKHVCHFCGKGFAIRNYLYYHIKSHQAEDKKQKM